MHFQNRIVLSDNSIDNGGYVLIGLRAPLKELFFQIPWGEPDVAQITRQRAAEIGVETTELEPWYDIDDASSLDQLGRDLADPRSAERAPSTMAWMRREGR